MREKRKHKSIRRRGDTGIYLGFRVILSLSLVMENQSQDVCARRVLEHRVALQVQVPSLMFAREGFGARVPLPIKWAQWHCQQHYYEYRLISCMQSAYHSAWHIPGAPGCLASWLKLCPLGRPSRTGPGPLYLRVWCSAPGRPQRVCSVIIC